MSKQIQEATDIYLAPEILGRFRDGIPVAIDERTNQELDPTNVDDKIKIYEREVKEWFLEPALRLVQPPDPSNSNFIVLMICMAYFEGVEQYKTGVSSSELSKTFFQEFNQQTVSRKI